MLHRRSALALTSLLAAPTTLRAQGSFPNRPLRLVCTYPPAGVTDIVSRLMAEPLGRILGQPVVVENRAGAGGQIGAMAVHQADADGYTLMLGTAAMFGVNPVLYASQGLVPERDFAHLGMVGVTPNVLSVNAKKNTIQSVAELVAAGKRGTLTMGSVGNGSSSHLSGVLFLKKAGFEATHVPYRGSSPTVAALLAGDVDFIFDTTASSTTQVRAGNFRGLAVTTAQRSFALPEVPTLQEAGVADYDLGPWVGLHCSAKVPEPIVTRLRAAVSEAMAIPATLQKLRDAYVEPYSVPEAQLGKAIHDSAAAWSQLARDANLRAD